MNTVVLYDSVFGNTEQIADAMASAIGESGPCRLVRIATATAADVAGADLVVVGSPTQGFHALPAVTAFLDALPEAAVAGKTFAVFDTRIALEDIPSAPLRWAVRVGGYAAPHLQKRLVARHARIAVEPCGFLVEGREGPLKAGEAARAAAWARKLARQHAAVAA